MLPPVERSKKGYRIYTQEHVAYFECIRGMADGFGIGLTTNVLKKIQNKEFDAGFWLVNEAQAALQTEKAIAEKTMKNILGQDTPLLDLDKKGYLTIHEISKETNIPITTIRHWEKVGLITVSRDRDNKYRLYNKNHIRQILVIHALKTSMFSYTYSLDGIKKIIQELDYNDVEKVSKIAADFQKHLDQINNDQMRGVYSLYGLCRKILQI